MSQTAMWVLIGLLALFLFLCWRGTVVHIPLPSERAQMGNYQEAP